MMLGTLLKKQLYELNRGFFYDAKKGKMRSKGAAAYDDLTKEFLKKNRRR